MATAVADITAQRPSSIRTRIRQKLEIRDAGIAAKDQLVISRIRPGKVAEDLGLLQKLLRLAPLVAAVMMRQNSNGLDSKQGLLRDKAVMTTKLIPTERLFSEEDGSTLRMKTKAGEGRVFEGAKELLVIADRQSGPGRPRTAAVVQIPIANGNRQDAIEQAKAAVFLLMHESMMQDLQHALNNKDFKQAGLIAAQMELNFRQSGIKPNGPAKQELEAFEGLMSQAREVLDAERERNAPVFRV